MFVYKEPTDAPVYNIEEDPHIKREAYITGDRMSTFMIYLSEVRINQSYKEINAFLLIF